MIVVTKLISPENEDEYHEYVGVFDNEDLAVNFLFENERWGRYIILETVTNNPDEVLGYTSRNIHQLSEDDPEAELESFDFLHPKPTPLNLPPQKGTEEAEEGPLEAQESSERTPGEQSPVKTKKPQEEAQAVSAPPKKEKKEKKNGRSKITEDKLTSLGDELLDLMEPEVGYARGWVIKEMGLTNSEWSKVSDKLLTEGRIRREGIKRGTKYYLVTIDDWSGAEEEELEEEELEGIVDVMTDGEEEGTLEDLL